MCTVQVNGAELVFTVIAEEVSISAFSTQCTYNFSDFLLNFESLHDPNVFLYYARICHNTSHLKENCIFCTVTRHAVFVECVNIFFLIQCLHMSFTDFVVFPPGHGRSVTDFSGWGAHEARLRCPDVVSGDIGGCSARWALKPNFY